MEVFIALLQGVNIGKNKRIAMTDFKRIITELGGTNPITIANSGNAVFAYAGSLSYEELRQAIEEAVTAHVGMDIPTVIRTEEELLDVIVRNPYPDAAADTKTLHVDFLLTEMPNALDSIDQGGEALTASGREIYLFAPNKLSGSTYDWKTLGKRLGTHHTSRNWNTILNLQAACTKVRET